MPTKMIKPLHAAANENPNLVPHYVFPFENLDPTINLLLTRKFALSQKEELLRHKKSCEKSQDIDGARFFRDEIAHHEAHYKACLYVIPHYYNDFPRDCRILNVYKWPSELFQAMDNVLLGIYRGSPR